MRTLPKDLHSAARPINQSLAGEAVRTLVWALYCLLVGLAGILAVVSRY